MTFDIERILSSKRVTRERMTLLPVGDKLRLLDALRARELVIRRSRTDGQASSVVRETHASYRAIRE